MANVLVNSTLVNKEQRNRRNYGAIVSTSQRSSSTVNPPQKAVIEFNTDTPTIPDYSIYADVYGQWPSIWMYTRDIYGSLIDRPEKPYYHFENGLIDWIEFGALSDGVQEGFIVIGI